MGPVRRAVARAIRVLGVACLVLGAVLGGLVYLQLRVRKGEFPMGTTLGAAGLMVFGLVVLLKGSAIAARLTDDFEE